MTNFSHFRTHVGADPEGFFKSTVFEGTSLRLGISCWDPGQSQPEHTHDGRAKLLAKAEYTKRVTGPKRQHIVDGNAGKKWPDASSERRIRWRFLRR